MATYNPPSANLSIFDSAVFNEVSPDSALTIKQGDLRYCKFPIAQGSETFPGISVAGPSILAGTNTLSGDTTLSGNTTLSGDTTLSGGTTISTDITLDKASGQQKIICSSAPSGLNFSTTFNTAPITFTTQSSAGVNTDVLKIQSANNPRVIMSVADVIMQDRTTHTQQCTITISSNGTNIKSTASSGQGGMIIDSSTSTSGAGAITLKTKDGTPSTTTGLILQGTALTAATAGGSSGQHLCLTINGTLYKIALLNA